MSTKYEQLKKRREERRAEGRCVDCDWDVLREGRSRCLCCAEKNRARVDRWRTGRSAAEPSEAKRRAKIENLVKSWAWYIEAARTTHRWDERNQRAASAARLLTWAKRVAAETGLDWDEMMAEIRARNPKVEEQAARSAAGRQRMEEAMSELGSITDPLRAE